MRAVTAGIAVLDKESRLPDGCNRGMSLDVRKSGGIAEHSGVEGVSMKGPESGRAALERAVPKNVDIILDRSLTAIGAVTGRVISWHVARGEDRLIVSVLVGDAENGPRPQADAGVLEPARGEEGKSRLVLPAIVIAELNGTGTLGGTDKPQSERQKTHSAITGYLDSLHFIPAGADWCPARTAAAPAYDHMLEPMDALIAATALTVQADALLTWGDHLLRLDGKPDFTVPVRKPVDGGGQGAFDLAGPGFDPLQN